MDIRKKEKRKINIAIVCDPVTDCIAGSFVSTLRFAEILSEVGHKVIFIAARSPKNPHDNSHKNIKAYRFYSVLLPKTEGQMYLSFPTYKKIKSIFKDEEIDLVHVTIPTPAAFVCTRVAKKMGIPVVAHSHTQPENVTMHLPMESLRKPLDWIFYKYLAWLYKKADALIYPTEFAKKLLEHINTDVKAVVISNGVDTKKFKKVDTKLLYKKFNINKSSLNILYVGRLHPEKSVDTLIKSMPQIIEKHPKAHLLIAGFGHLDKSLLNLTEKLGVSNFVTFLGKVSDDELIMAYNLCDIFVLPSLIELEGMVVLEAMACGKPIVIANSKDSASPYFVDENGYLFEPKNHVNLADQISRLLSDNELRKKMGKVSHLKSKQYDIYESIERLENLYLSLLK